MILFYTRYFVVSVDSPVAVADRLKSEGGDRKTSYGAVQEILGRRTCWSAVTTLYRFLCRVEEVQV